MRKSIIFLFFWLVFSQAYAQPLINVGALSEILQPPAALSLATTSNSAMDISSVSAGQHQSNVMPGAGTEQNVSNSPHLSLTTILLFAFIGGIILNIMPCVLPIIFIKVVALKYVTKRKLYGLFYTLGVLAGFLVFALIIVGFKNIGTQIGWGFQMQSPIFILALVFLFALIGFNLFGMFELPTPWKGNIKVDQVEELTYAFLTGILACVVTTPCSGPFMAAALGAVMSLSSLHIIATFLMLGMGFALPFLLAAVIHKTEKMIPKPGAWMVKVRQFLGFPILFTSLWLLWVFGSIVGVNGMTLVLVSLSFLGFTFWIYSSIKQRTIAWFVSVLSMGLVIYPLMTIKFGDEKDEEQLEKYSFSQSKLNQLLDEKRKVFVYATAKWCITCKFNEKVALTPEATTAFMIKENVAVMKADWTNKNGKILKFLQKYERTGIPLYVYYDPSGKATVLPQLLTPSIIIDTIKAQKHQ